MRTFTLSCIAFVMMVSCATKKNDQSEADCPPKACTMEFRTVGVIFKDAQGDTISVKDFSVKLKSTGKKLPSASSGTQQPTSPFYLVANDGDKSALAVSGDTLLISGKHPATNAIKTSEMVISGGRCACHITRVSGNEVITF